MRTLSGGTLITCGSVALVVVAVVAGFIWCSADGSVTVNAFRIERQELEGRGNVASTLPTNVAPDYFRLKYEPARSAKFHVTSSRSIAIFVRTTGVQVRTASGWQAFSEEPRNEIWRLSPGMARELFVERPQKETEQTWRLFVRYGAELQGPPLWKAQLREALILRSFTNWTGKAWGGGRFGGENEFLSGGFAE